MRKLYQYLGVKKSISRRSPRAQLSRSKDENKDITNRNKSKNKFDLKDLGLGIITGINRMQLNYSENNSSFLPGYLPTPGFIGTLKPTFGYTMGSQRDVRQISAKNGWLTTFDQFNQQYTESHNENLDYAINTELIQDLKLDFTGGKTYATNFTENFNTDDT